MAGAGRALIATLALALLLAACGRSDDESVEVRVDGTPVATLSPTATASGAPTEIATSTATPEPIPLDPTSPPSILDAEALRGFTFPIEGACLPGSDRLMPNAPREYRNGIHEGIDFYPGATCAAIGAGTPVLAMYGGVVIRADLDYVDITPEQVNELAAKTAQQGFTDDETLDIYRGRQVWIDHGNGIVTRYAHLLEIAEGIDEGVEVQRGEVIGGVGESGTPEFITAPGTELHLHAEVRVGEGFLGADLDPATVRLLYERLFGPEAEPPTEE